MMQQYKKIKEKYRDTILFFRLGDFYEMFEGDAIEASKLLNLTLTKRNGVPMCGIPYHASKNYILKLLQVGKKVAICEQTFIPKAGKGIARREVVEVITPGTVVDEELLEQYSNNYLLSIGRYKDRYSLAYIDLSTSEFCATSFSEDEKKEHIRKELNRISPREVIVQESLFESDNDINMLLRGNSNIVINRFPDWNFDIDICREKLKKQLSVANLKGFGIDDYSPEIVAAGTILDYLESTSKSVLPHITNFRVYRETEYVGLDESTQRNLELIRNMQDNSKRYTLFEVLNNTKTAMGARKLTRWILNPLRDEKEINERLSAVEFFYKNQLLLASFRDTVSKVLDMERLSSKVAMNKATPKDLVAIKAALKNIVLLYEQLEGEECIEKYIKPIRERLVIINSIVDLIEISIKEEPSVVINDGNIIKKGYNSELDRLRDIRDNSREILKNYLEREKEKTGINNLKLKYNRVIGYFLEVTKSNLHLVPDYYIRRQTLVNGERFSTEELGKYEVEINNASEKIVELERKIFLEIHDKVKKNVRDLLKIANSVSDLDVFQSFAFGATVRGYIKPRIVNQSLIKINAGRHPVVELALPNGAFIPNDTNLSNTENYLMILTGPNMAGKSTYLRQVALIVLMAHIGSFVPAEEAEIGIVDQIFCRVGATDNLARGESTFLVEMNETANIIRSATDRSLVIMDEVGRGTGTRDGLAIAWAVVEYLLDRLKAIVLFATHYHELTQLRAKGLVNMSMDVVERGNEIIFMKRVISGPADQSYGVHVARLAGIPDEIIERVNYLLENKIEKFDMVRSIGEDGAEERLTGALKANSRTDRVQEKNEQLTLFNGGETVINRLRQIDVNNMTPLEALNLIAELKREIE